MAVWRAWEGDALQFGMNEAAVSLAGYANIGNGKGTVDVQLRRGKRAIRQYLRTAYTEERLVWLLAHARNGKLTYQSCCCLIGVATADHPLRANADVNEASGAHYHLARKFLGAREAEQAYWELGYIGASRFVASSDELRRRRLVPMILSEIRQRERSKGSLGQIQTESYARLHPRRHLSDNGS